MNPLLNFVIYDMFVSIESIILSNGSLGQGRVMHHQLFVLVVCIFGPTGLWSYEW